MLNTDKPINQISEDKLGRSSFAKQLANAIMNFQTKDNYAISLQGKWGCGKTSVLNMAIEEIEELQKNLDETDKIIIIQFNPWNFTDTNQLINQFFLTLTNSLKEPSKDKRFKDIGAAIEKYSSALEYTEYIPVVGKYLKLIPKLLSKFGKTVKDNAELKLNDVSYRKSKVEEELLKLNSRILVVIDDIDRLSNEQIRLIFQLVNAVAGFPNITYLLSFDKDIVSRALGDVQKCEGQEYLEKIIQIPFDLPPVNITKLHNILFDKLDVLFGKPSSELDKGHWTTVFNSCISPFIKTLRDVNRYCNALSFRYAAVKSEVDFIDMAGVSALQIFASPIFEWIRENKFTLVGGYSNRIVSANKLNEQREETIQRFKELYPEHSNIMENAIESLFPLSNSVLSPSELHQEMRISAEAKFDLYFSLSLDIIKISRKEIEDSLQYMEEQKLRDFIQSLRERELFNDYLYEIKHNLSRIPKDRIELILSVLAFQSGRVKSEGSKLTGFNTADISIYTISDLLFIIDDENTRYDIVAHMLSNTDFESFQFLLHLLHVIELTHGRVAETQYVKSKKLVTLEHLYKLEGVFLERTKHFLTKTDLLDWKESQRASFLWEFIDKNSYISYMNEALSDSLSVLKYISMIANEWSASDGSRGYTFKDKSYTNFIDDATIIDTINKERLIDSFWELDKRLIETSAAFILKSTNTEGNHEGNISLINELIDRWKKEFKEKAT